MSYTPLRIACPGRECTSRYSRGINWTHYKCGGVIEINDVADLRCKICLRASNVFRWGFDCGSHPACDRFQLPSIDALSSVIAMATEMTDEMGASWYKKLLQNLVNTCG